MARRKSQKRRNKKYQVSNRQLKTKRPYKDTIFRMLYHDKENLLSLYNAVNGRNYTNVEDLQIVTLENAIYMGMKNDLAFIMDMYLYLGLSKDNASMSVSITLIFLSALLTGLGWYDRIAKHAGAGTLVPITGFANSVAAPALEFKTEGYILGLGAKIFIISGPVILYGTLASVLYGLIYYLFLR